MITWTISINAITGTARYTPVAAGGGDTFNLSIVRAGDYVNVAGSNFFAANRGSFVVAYVSIDYPLGVLTQFVDVVNPAVVAQSGVVQASHADVSFFRPYKASLNDSGLNAVVVAQTDSGLDVVLPATTQAIVRGLNSGSYLHANPGVPVTSFTRDLNGTVTVTATNHGFVTGQLVQIDGVAPNNLTPLAPSWASTDLGSVAAGNAGSALVPLTDGRVLVSGGGAAPGTTTSYLFDPASGWTTASPMLFTRTNHTLTVLANGKVLATGGAASNVSSELFDPLSSTWTATGTPAVSHASHTATLLKDGRVLVLGGAATNQAEIYTPSLGSWSAAAAPLSNNRRNHASILMYDGRILACGGLTGAGGGTVSSSSEVYSALNDSWQAGGALAFARQKHTLTTLDRAGGQIFMAGGTLDGTNGIAATEMLVPGTLAWTTGPSLNFLRFSHSASVTKNGRVVMIGGSNAGADLSAVERYDPLLKTLSILPPLLAARSQHGSTRLNDGRIFVQGGTGHYSEAFGLGFAVQAAGRLNGVFPITSLGASSFSFVTTDTTLPSAGMGGTATAIAAASNGIGGPYIYDTNSGAAVTGVASTTTQDLVVGQSYKTLSIADTTGFIDSPGYLVFGFGTSKELRPVRYLGVLSSTQLLLDPSYSFFSNISSGGSVTLLRSRSTFVPPHPETTGSFYATASAAARVQAQATIASLVAAGVNVTTSIVYPGDRGLGNEGLPAHGTAKLSDKVLVWGSDEIDAELKAAKGS